MSRLFLAWLVAVAVAGIPASSDAQGAPPATTPTPAALETRLDRMRTAVFTRGQPPDAIVTELRAILAEAPGATEAHLLLGIVYDDMGVQEFAAEAIAEFRQAIALDPSFMPARFFLARSYLNTGRTDRAREELEAALADMPPRPDFLALLGEAERRSGRPERSVELTRQAIVLDGRYALARYYLGLALLDLGEEAAALAELEPVVRGGAAPPEGFLVLGTTYRADGRTNDAIEVLARGVAAAPTRADLHLELARAYREADRLAEAEAELGRAYPADAVAEASARLEALVADIAVEIGLIRMAQGDLAAAAASLEQALAMRPTDGPTHGHLAEVYLRQGQPDRAREHAGQATAP